MLAARVMPAARDPRSGVDAVKIDDRYVVGCGANCDSDCRLHGLLHHITYAIWRLHHMRYGGNIHTTFVIPVGRYRTNDFCVLNLRNRLNISRRRYIIYTTHLLGREIPCHVADCPLPKHLPIHDSTLRMGARARRAARPAIWGAKRQMGMGGAPTACHPR